MHEIRNYDTPKGGLRLIIEDDFIGDGKANFELFPTGGNSYKKEEFKAAIDTILQHWQPYVSITSSQPFSVDVYQEDSYPKQAKKFDDLMEEVADNLAKSLSVTLRAKKSRGRENQGRLI